MRTAYTNGKFVYLRKAGVSILDRGFQYGDGVFETMRSYGGTVFRLEKHITRLFRSLKALHIRPKISKSEIQKIVYNLLKKNKLKDAYVKIIITRGTNAQPTVAIYVLPYTPPPESVYKRGVKLYISGITLSNKSKVAGHKTLNYLNNLLCRYEAKSKGCYEALLTGPGGYVSEASSSNIFLVKGEKIYTPGVKSGILPGITREEVIYLAGKYLKKKVSEDYINISALYKAGEVFLTNSLAEIVPVVQIGKNIVGSGKPGPVTKRIAELFKELRDGNV